MRERMYVVASMLEEHFEPLERLGKKQLEQHAEKTKTNLLQATQHRSVAELRGFRSALAETHYELNHDELRGLLDFFSRKLPDAAEAEDQRGKIGGALRAVLIDYYSKKAADVKKGADLRPSRPLREVASRALETFLGEGEEEAAAEFKEVFGPLAAPALKRIVAADDELEAHAKKFREAASKTSSVQADVLSERLNNMRTPLRTFATLLLEEVWRK